MISHEDAMASKMQTLRALLDDPHADDDEWAVDLLYTLEAIYEIALHPEKQVVAASHANHAIAA